MNGKRQVRRAGSAPFVEDALRALLGAAQSVEQRMEDALGEVGLSTAKFIALTLLAEAGEPLNLSQCAARMTCVRSNITQLMDRLEADKLVRRVEDPTDRRTVHAALTPLGIEKQIAGVRQVGKVSQALSKKLSKSDWQALTRMLSALK